MGVLRLASKKDSQGAGGGSVDRSPAPAQGEDDFESEKEYSGGAVALEFDPESTAECVEFAPNLGKNEVMRLFCLISRKLLAVKYSVLRHKVCWLLDR